MAWTEIEEGCLRTRAEAMEDIRETGFWPTTFVSNQSPEQPVHEHDIIGHVVEGETCMLDEDEAKIAVGPGDCLVTRKHAWHVEGDVTHHVVYLTSIREPAALLGAILPREPRGPFRSFD